MNSRTVKFEEGLGGILNQLNALWQFYCVYIYIYTYSRTQISHHLDATSLIMLYIWSPKCWLLSIMWFFSHSSGQFEKALSSYHITFDVCFFLNFSRERNHVKIRNFPETHFVNFLFHQVWNSTTDDTRKIT